MTAGAECCDQYKQCHHLCCQFICVCVCETATSFAQIAFSTRPLHFSLMAGAKVSRDAWLATSATNWSSAALNRFLKARLTPQSKQQSALESCSQANACLTCLQAACNAYVSDRRKNNFRQVSMGILGVRLEYLRMFGDQRSSPIRQLHSSADSQLRYHFNVCIQKWLSSSSCPSCVSLYSSSWNPPR